MNYFGTDGIRGVYGKEVTCELAYRLGAVLGAHGNIVLLSRDTRLSGERLLNACIQGIYSSGGTAINLGILPTNSVAHFVRKLGGHYGVMISASHNPPEHNGLKVFDWQGVKLKELQQIEISMAMASIDKVSLEGAVHEPVFYDIDNIYCEDIAKAVDVQLSGLKVAMDCAYGASYKVAQKIFQMCGAKTVAYCNRELGDKINVNCGATHIETLQEHMLHNDCVLGFAMDGDSDRLAVLEGNTVLDGNAVLLAISRYLAEGGKLHLNTVVGTTLTNSGLERALLQHDIRLLRSEVGDINVATMMSNKGLNVGGEDSGHYILTDYATTSDSLLVALLVSKIYIEKGSLLAYTSSYQAVNSININIDTSRVDRAFTTTKSLSNLASNINNNYHNSRIVLRPSGTESKIRCYIEGDNCQEIAELVVATIASD